MLGRAADNLFTGTAFGGVLIAQVDSPAAGPAALACSIVGLAALWLRLSYADKAAARTEKTALTNAENARLVAEVAELKERNQRVVKGLDSIPSGDIRHGRSVLLVEDTDAIAMPLIKLLRLNGHRVRRVTDIATAIREFDSEPPDVLLCDLILPDGDGEIMLRHARAAQLPCRLVVTTGVCDDTRLANIRRMGATLMIKPIDADVLLDTLRAGLTELDLPVITGSSDGIKTTE